MTEELKQFWGKIWSQSAEGCKVVTRLAKLTLKKTGEDRYYHRKFEKDT